jgi:peptide/nickel transport system substrate-binding protein
MKKIFFSSLILVVALGLLLISSCANPSTQTTTQKPATSIVTTSTPITSTTAKPTTITPKSGGTFKFGLDVAGVSGLGWQADVSASKGSLITPICMDAVFRADKNGNILPSLATKWDLSADSKIMTLTLRQGVKFHDGSDWNATVAKWNIDQLIAAKISDFVRCSSVNIVDDYTIQLNWTSYTNTILNTLTTSYMMSKQAFDEKGGKDFLQWNPVGTGSFKFVNYTKDVGVKYARFDNYWNGKPYLDAVEVYFIADPLTRAASFQAGEMDAVGGLLAKPDYDLQQKGYQITPVQMAVYLLMPDSKNTDSPWSKLKVRQALDYAIDRDSIAKALGYGFWTSNYQFALPGNPAYINNLAIRAYNPDKAKQLLTEAGYPTGFSTTIGGQTATSSKEALTAIQGYMDKVNIKAQINMLELGPFVTMSQKGWNNTLLCCANRVDFNVNSSMNSNWTKTSIMNTSVDKTDDLQALYNASAAAKQYDGALAQKLIQYIFDTAMVIPVYNTPNGCITQSYVRDMGAFTAQPWFIWYPEKTWLNK